MEEIFKIPFWSGLAGGFVLSIAASIIVDRYHFWSPFRKATRVYDGVSSDMNIIDAEYGVDNKKTKSIDLEKFDLNGDFQTKESHFYEMRDLEFSFYSNRILMRGKFVNNYTDKTVQVHRIHGKGSYISGDHSRGMFYIYVDSRDDGSIEKELYIFKFNRYDIMEGYFLGQNYRNLESFSIGPIVLRQIR